MSLGRIKEGKTYSNINDVDADTTHDFLSANALLRCPLEGSNTRVLDLVEVLHTLRDVDDQVGAGRVRTETPDLAGVGDIPTVLVSKNARARLEIVTWVDLALLDGGGELLTERHRLREETVVLVLRLGESDNRRLGLDSLTIRNDRVGDLERNTSVVFLEILS